jgi:nitroreductase
MQIGEAMFSQRAIRRLRHDKPISDADLKIVLDAASKAPSGANSQPARFLVIRNRERIQAFGKLYHEAWWAKRRDEYGWKDESDIPQGSVYRMPALLAVLHGTGRRRVVRFPGRSESVAGGAGARYRIGTDHAARRRHGPGIRTVQHTRRRGVSLLYSTRLSARQVRAHAALTDRGDHQLEHLGHTATLEIAARHAVDGCRLNESQADLPARKCAPR